MFMAITLNKQPYKIKGVDIENGNWSVIYTGSAQSGVLFTGADDYNLFAITLSNNENSSTWKTCVLIPNVWGVAYFSCVAPNGTSFSIRVNTGNNQFNLLSISNTTFFVKSISAKS